MTDRPSPAVPLVEATALGKRFADRWLFRDTSLSLAPGESLALLGDSGTGKSTFLNLVSGLEPFEEGQLTVAGHRFEPGETDPDASARLRREHIGFVFQAFHLLPHLAVWQNVALPLLLNGAQPEAAREPSVALLDRVDLSHAVDARPASLSGGEQQRVALARALVHAPALLLADEPTGNLDPDTAGRALDLIGEVVRETGCGLLLVTHSEQAASLCGRRLRLQDGHFRSVDRGHDPSVRVVSA